MQDGPEFRHLVAFVTVAEECNFGKASQRLHVTQPALSTQIKQLESWLGAHVFKRVPYGAELTERGRSFLPYARRLLLMRHHALSAVSRKYSDAEWPLRLGYSLFANHELVQEALRGYQEIVPEGQLNLPSDCTAKLVEMMVDGRLDAAIVTLPTPMSGVFQYRICEERFLVCLRRDDPLAAAAEIPQAVIAERLRILFHRDIHPALYDYLFRRFKRAGIELQPTESYSAPTEMQFLVKTRGWFGLTREHTRLDPELAVRPIAGIDLRIATALIGYREQERPLFPMLASRMTERWMRGDSIARHKLPSARSLGTKPIGIKKVG